MKKKIYSMVMATTLIAGLMVHSNVNKSNTVSDVLMSNVEALAQGESGGYTGCRSGDGYCAIYLNGSLIFSSYSHYPY